PLDRARCENRHRLRPRRRYFDRVLGRGRNVETIVTTKITRLTVEDIRFPTSAQLDGSDAMNPDPDYSAAYVVLHTNQPGLEGHGLTFTIGRGNEICCAAINAIQPLIGGRGLDWIPTHLRV